MVVHSRATGKCYNLSSADGALPLKYAAARPKCGVDNGGLEWGKREGESSPASNHPRVSRNQTSCMVVLGREGNVQNKVLRATVNQGDQHN